MDKTSTKQEDMAQKNKIWHKKRIFAFACLLLLLFILLSVGLSVGLWHQTTKDNEDIKAGTEDPGIVRPRPAILMQLKTFSPFNLVTIVISTD